MKKTFLLFLIISALLFGSCISSSYFLSPSNANSNPYHAIPLVSDSLKGATYVSGIFTMGGANQGWRDNVFAFQGRLHRSNNLGSFQTYYGANATLGSYRIAEFYSPNSYPYDTVNFHYYSTNSFFGYYGLNGGINLVVPTGHGGEWRPLGIETAVHREFGNYYNFRKNLPDSAADVTFKKNITGNIGIYTEIIHKSKHGAEFGYKMGWNFILNPSSDYTHVYSPNSVNPIGSFVNTIHFSKGKATGFVQINISNSYAGNVQFGLNYRLGKQ